MVHQYTSPAEMKKYIERLADLVRLDKFENVLVNMNGGMFLFEALAGLQGYTKEPKLIEYHRPKDGFGAIVTISVPKELRGTRATIVDDILDSGGVLRAIRKELDPDSQTIALVTKNGIQDQIQVPNVTIGLRVDNKWLGGCGMDMSVPNEANSFRNYPGLVVKIPD